MKNALLLLLSFWALASCDSTTEPSNSDKDSGLSLVHSTPVVVGNSVRFYLIDTFTSDMPHTYRWSIEGEEPFIDSSNSIYHIFSRAGKFKISVTVFDKYLEKLGEGNSEIEVSAIYPDSLLITHPKVAADWSTVKFVVHDSSLRDLPRTYHWKVKGEPKPIITTINELDQQFKGKGKYSVEVTIKDSNDYEVGRGRTEIEVSYLLDSFAIKIEQISEFSYRYILSRPDTLPMIDARWTGTTKTGDTLILTYPHAGRYSERVTIYHFEFESNQRSIDTTIDVGNWNALPPPVDLFYNCEVKVSFTADNMPAQWSNPSEKFLTYSHGTYTQDTGNFHRDEFSYHHNNSRFNSTTLVTITDTASWQFSSDFRRLEHIVYRRGYDNQLTSDRRTRAARVIGAVLIWSDNDRAIYLSQDPGTPETIGFAESEYTSHPPNLTGLVSINWNGRPRPYAMVMFTRK